MVMEAVERLLKVIGGRRVGLVTGPTGWLQEAGHLIDILHTRGLLAALFAPEHGVWGDLQAGERVPDGRDPRTGVVVHSLYGRVHEPTDAMLADLLRKGGRWPVLMRHLPATARGLEYQARIGSSGKNE